ncbi:MULTISPECIES: hypothetical protein [Mesorhizobium]|uniref:hypothetical protein n=1 Tax=Mesorhizobium TaxID=68287 RepID=UPI001459FE5D|nr:MULTISPECIES: hypothetical protein [Mesorhizobium]
MLAEFPPIELTEKHATVRKRTIRIGEQLDDQSRRKLSVRGLIGSALGKMARR